MKINDLVSAINEDIGNLKLLQGKFRNIFASGYPKKQQLAHKLVGRDSPIESVEVAKAKDALAALFDTTERYNSKVVGIVLAVNGTQFLAIVKDGGKQFEMTIDGMAIHQLSKDKAVVDKIGAAFKGYSTGTIDTGVDNRRISEPKLRSILNNVFKIIKESGAAATAFVIKRDDARLAKQSDRKAARVGLLPSSGEEIRGDQFKRATRQALMSRFDKFKAAKAKEYNTPEEFMAAAIKEGFMDKINVGGFIYELKEDSLRLSDIVKPEGWHKSNAIAYRIDSHHNAKLEQLSQKLWDLKQEAKDKPELESKVEEFKAKFPPREIRVIMGMQGGSIVPTSVEVVDKQYY